MSVWERAWYCVSRKKKKSMLLFLLLLLLASAMAGSMAAGRTVSAVKQNLEKNIKAGFTVSAEGQDTMLPLEAAEKIREAAGVSYCTYWLQTRAKLLEGEQVLPVQDDVWLNRELLEEEQGIVTVQGSTDSSEDMDFITKRLKLVKGRHIKKSDTGKVLVHQAAAEKNGWKLRDNIRFSSLEDTAQVQEGEVVGIYSGSSEEPWVFPADRIENTIYTDLETAQKSAGMTEGSKGLSSASYYVSNPAKVQKTVEKIRELPINPEAYEIKEHGEEYAGILEAVGQMEKLLQLLLGGIAGVSIFVLTLVFIFWIQNRLHETGILLAVGVSKGKIAAQYMLELCMIAALSFALAFFLGEWAGTKAGRQMVQQEKEISAEALKDAGQEEKGYAVFWKEAAFVYGAGFGILVLSAGFSSLVILRMKPKEILSKMS